MKRILILILVRLIFFLPALLWAGIIYQASNTPNLAIVDHPSDFWLRKIAHLMVYAALLVLTYFGVAATTKIRWHTKPAIIATIIVILYALLDEYHQSQVPTRNGSFIDIGIDLLGAGFGLAIIGWLEWWHRVTHLPIDNQSQSWQQQFNQLGQSISLEQLPRLAALLAQQLKGGEVIALTGQLGAGKTTFTKALAKELGVQKTISSPTYLIEKQYPIKPDLTLYHHDWYRLDSPESVIELGVQDKMGQASAIIIIEWPDRASQLLPSQTIQIEFTYVDQQTRQITLHS